MKLNKEQRKYLRENHKKIPDLIKLTQAVFLDETLDGRSKEGRAVKDFLIKEELNFNTTKKEKKEPINLTDDQKEEILDLAEDGLSSFQIAQIVFPDVEVKVIYGAEICYVIPNRCRTTLISAAEKPKVKEKYMPPSSTDEVIQLVNLYLNTGLESTAKLYRKKVIRKLVHFLQAPRFVNTINNYRDKEDRELFEAEFVRATWEKPDLTTDEVNLYINVCIDYINLRNISRNIEKLNRMFNDADSQQEMTVRLAELLKTKSEEYDKCEKRMESLIKKLNGDRARRIESKQGQNANILSLVESFQSEKKEK